MLAANVATSHSALAVWLDVAGTASDKVVSHGFTWAAMQRSGLEAPGRDAREASITAAAALATRQAAIAALAVLGSERIGSSTSRGGTRSPRMRGTGSDSPGAREPAEAQL